MFLLFFSLSASWTPVFHQGFAKLYLDHAYPNITSSQKDSFLLGSMYADGVEKTVTHFVRPVIRELNSITNRNSNLYWFFLGVMNHISIDTFAHAGKDKSFIVASGWRHHLSELTICAWAQWNMEPEFKLITRELKNQIQGLGIGFRTIFRIIYPICYFVTKIPFHFILLPLIQKDGCSSCSYSEADCNFRRHVDAMMKATEIIMQHANDPGFNEIDVKTITLAELQKVECCGDSANIYLNEAGHFPVSQEFPFMYEVGNSML